MNAHGTRPLHRFSRIAAAAVAVLVVSAVVLAPSAEAHGKRSRHKHHAKHVHVHRGYEHATPGYARFVVPQRISHARVVRYEPYYHGRVWYAPHRHHHVVYHFPVVTGYGIIHVPHTYCGEALHTTGHVSLAGPRFGLHIRF